MLERPNLSDAALIDCLNKNFPIRARGLEFLPVGNDATAWVYRVDAAPGEAYFLKVKQQGALDQASLSVPRFLYERGLHQVVAPLPGRSGALSCPLEAYHLILYPFIQGQSGMSAGLTDEQWHELGAVLRHMHAIREQDGLIEGVPVERFVPPWAETVKALTARVRDGQFSDDLQASLGAFWQSRQAEIERILARTEDLGRRLQESLPERVLCHADIHTANVLVTAAGGLFIVDWDQPIFAPKERDLMFVLGMPGADSSRAESMFFRGYGPTRANPLALAYYRYEWVVQEIGDFAARVFLSPNPGEATRQHAVEGFITLFAPGDVVEEAYQSDQI